MQTYIFSYYNFKTCECNIFPIASAAVAPAGTSRILPSGRVTFGMVVFPLIKLKKPRAAFLDVG